MADTKTIPPIVLKKYPEIVSMIQASSSMDENERNYWFNMLVIMTPKQVENLKSILEREKQKLSDVSAQQSSNASADMSKPLDETKIKAIEDKKQALVQEEAKFRESEKKQEEDLLNQIANL